MPPGDFKMSFVFKKTLFDHIFGRLVRYFGLAS
jgi:hypothetical protein